MKCILPLLLIFSILLASCQQPTRAPQEAIQAPPPETDTISAEIPERVVLKSELDYDNQTSTWSWNGEAYSGYMVRFHPDSSLQEKTGLLNGKRQNESKHWYPDGHLQRVAHYHEGKLHGEKKSWSPDSPHILLAQLSYQKGRPHGEQKQWYPTGELYKKLNLNMGREEGIQQAFRENGALYANYEAKEGRIFGLKKAALCYRLEDETIKYEE